MTFLLDHLAAIVVGAILLGALAVFQQRSQEGAIASVEEYRDLSRAAELATIIEREVENARGRAETEAAFVISPTGGAAGTALYRFGLRRDRTADGTEYTSQFAFPTLADPDALSASPVQMVTYHVEDTRETALVDGRRRALLQATRYEYVRGGAVRRTSVYGGLVDFDVVAVGAGGVETLEGPFAATPSRLKVELRVAPRGADGEGVTSTRHARTIRVTAATLTGAGRTADESLPGGIPALPGDPTGPLSPTDPAGPTPTGPTPIDPTPTDPTPVDPAPTDPTPTDPTPTDPVPTDPVLDPNEKVPMCHDPAGKNDDKMVRRKDIEKHIAHGDYMGACR